MVFNDIKRSLDSVILLLSAAFENTLFFGWSLVGGRSNTSAVGTVISLQSWPSLNVIEMCLRASKSRSRSRSRLFRGSLSDLKTFGRGCDRFQAILSL